MLIILHATHIILLSFQVHQIRLQNAPLSKIRTKGSLFSIFFVKHPAVFCVRP